MTEWERCKPWIEAALAYADGCYLIEDVFDEIRNEQAILWPGKRSACVTQIQQYPRKRVLCLWLAGGDMKELLRDLLPQIEDFARKAGFDAITEAGRRGWSRVLGKHGYTPILTVLGKSL